MPRQRSRPPVGGDSEYDTLSNDYRLSDDEWGAPPRPPPPKKHTLGGYMFGGGRVLKVIRTCLNIPNKKSLDNAYLLASHYWTFDVTFKDTTTKLTTQLIVPFNTPQCQNCTDKTVSIQYGTETTTTTYPTVPGGGVIATGGQGVPMPVHQGGGPVLIPISQLSPHRAKLLSDLQVTIHDKKGDKWKDVRTEIIDVGQPFLPINVPLFSMSEIEEFFDGGNRLTLHLTFRFYSNQSEVLSFKSFEDRAKNNILRKLANMRKTKNQPDMTLVSKEGREFYCHEELLKERSSFFTDTTAVKAHITNGFRQYHLDLPSKAIIFLLHFLYRSEIHVKILGEAASSVASENVEDLEQLLLTARKFQVPELLTFFDDNLIKLCWEENAPALLKLARTYHLPSAAEDIINTFDLHDDEMGEHLLCTFGCIRLHVEEEKSKGCGTCEENASAIVDTVMEVVEGATPWESSVNWS